MRRKRKHEWRFEKTIFRNRITKKLTSRDDPEAVAERVPAKRIRVIGGVPYKFERNEAGRIEAVALNWPSEDEQDNGPLFEDRS